jgi:hypothetical protein
MERPAEQMTKMALVSLFLFLPALLLPLSTAAQDNKELIDQLKKIINVEPSPCQDDKKCYCYEITAIVETPLSLRYAKAQYCPVEVRAGHIIFAFKSWDKDGNKVDEGHFLNGKMDGLWIGWHPNGVKANELYFTNGKEDGQFIKWHDNGQIAFQGHYKESMPHGEWCFWDETGKPTKKIVWDSGKLVSKEEFK